MLPPTQYWKNRTAAGERLALPQLSHYITLQRRVRFDNVLRLTRCTLAYHTDLRHIAWCIRAVFAFAVFAIGRMFSGISAWVLKMLFLFGSYYLYNLGHLVPFLLLFIIGFVGIVAPLAAEVRSALTPAVHPRPRPAYTFA